MNWFQVAGHKGNFKVVDDGTILKKYSKNEMQCFQKLRDDALCRFVPNYFGLVMKGCNLFLKMTNLLENFDHPNVMDCKIGVRTYLEKELVRAKLRKDLYMKMVKVDKDAPTPKEHDQRGITKLRYMQWRETMSSSNTLGFRIDGIKKHDGLCQNDFKKTKLEADIIKVLKDFIGGDVSIITSYLDRLTEIQETLRMSEFFKSHEVIGSSLLFIHDHTGKAEIWIIDFAKTTPLPKGVTLHHDVPWQEGNREDGYLWGLENLFHILESISDEGPDGFVTKEMSQSTETHGP